MSRSDCTAHTTKAVARFIPAGLDSFAVTIRMCGFARLTGCWGVTPDGFTPWDGTREFRGDRMLIVRFRNGATSKDALPAYKWRGKWGRQRNGKRFPDGWDYDIIAVRVVG